MQYVLIIKDKTLAGESIIYGSDFDRLKQEGLDNVFCDRKNITAEVWSLKEGKKHKYMINCNELLNSYSM